MKTKLAGMGGAPAQTYVDDVFSTYLYTGNGSTQTITNGIDLAGKGGMVWIKPRDVGGTNHMIFDTNRNIANWISSNTTTAQTNSFTSLTAFNSDGFNLGSNAAVNNSPDKLTSWTFRKAAKFFDVVTWTGDGTTNKVIPHSLGSVPGFILVKATSAANGWNGYHRSLGATQSITINSTNAAYTSATAWNNTEPTSTQFFVGDNTNCNSSGVTYVAYLFAHDTSSTGIIQCGGFTTDASGVASISLGWEPQYLLYKNIDSAVRDWNIVDTMRGFTVSSAEIALYANSSQAESSYGNNKPTATGITFDGNASSKYIYMAIRRPNKPPTSGMQVFNANTAGTAEANTAKVGFYSGFPVDMVIYRQNKTNAQNETALYDRLRGSGKDIRTNTTSAEGASMFPIDASLGAWNTALATDINKLAWMFKRAPGFFDVVCYTGTGVTRTVAHNLTVAPELMIVKARTDITQWEVYNNFLGNTKSLYLNLTDSQSGTGSWNNTTPTSTTFTVTNAANVNASTITYVAYLFATLAGIQYINSYVGDGTTGRVINCGFSAGARFICIKATSTTGSWWVWDSARGITSTNDPALQLNSTAAEITSADAIDPSSSGFIVNQEATCSINASGVSYLVWAIA